MLRGARTRPGGSTACAGLAAVTACALAVAVPAILPAQASPAPEAAPWTAGEPAGGDLAAGASARRCRQPDGLRPAGRTRARYTMLLRIKNFADVAAYSSPDGELRGRLRRRDLFLINTRRKWATPERVEELVRRLKANFPCNRIIALNGIARRPRSPSYMLTLARDRRVYALMLDWEASDWAEARAVKPTMGSWSTSFPVNRRRVARDLRHLVRNLKRAGRRGKRIGLAPYFYPAWEYAKLQQTLNRRSRGLARHRQGVQSVQLQRICQYGAHPYGRAVAQLRRGYRQLGLSTRRLALQVSFTNTPIRGDSRPVNSVRPRRAARCTRQALRQRGGAILYWAKPDAVRALLKRRFICWLRPPPRGRGC